MGTLVSAQSLTTPEGRWKTVDDETGQTKSIVEIYKRSDGTYDGKIVEILTDKKDAVCDKCSGAKKNKPILGMVIIEDLEADDDYWSDGEILDPNKGSTYGLSVWYEDKNPNTLYVRGKHWSGFYRTQTWTRE